MSDLVSSAEKLDYPFSLMSMLEMSSCKVPNYNGYFVIEGDESNKFAIKQACNIRIENNGAIRMEYLTPTNFAVVFVWENESITVNYAKFGKNRDKSTFKISPQAYFTYYQKTISKQPFLEFPIDEMLFLVYNNTMQHNVLQDKVIGIADGFYLKHGKESNKISLSFTLSLVGDLFNEN